jgi:hypothetical protein
MSSKTISLGRIGKALRSAKRTIEIVSCAMVRSHFDAPWNPKRAGC